MPCYIEDVEATTGMEHGRVVRSGGHRIFWCGSGDDQHCADCMGFGDFLCDYPVGEGKTCERAMCRHHRHSVAPEIDYCTAHYAEWEAFKARGGVKERLENVIPFRSER